MTENDPITSQLEDLIPEVSLAWCAGALINTTPWIIADFETKKLVAVSPHACKILGYEFGELHGKPIRALLPDSKRDQHDFDISEWAQNPRRRIMGDHSDAYVRRKDGSLIQVLLALYPVEDGPPDKTLAMIPMHDVIGLRKQT